MVDPVQRRTLPGFRSTIPWHDRPLDMVLSAAQGCHLCALSVGANGNCYKRLAAKQSPAHVGWTGQMEAISIGLQHSHGYEGLSSQDPVCLVQQPCGMSYANVWWSPSRDEAGKRTAKAVQPGEMEDGPPLPLHASTGHPEALRLCAWWLRKCLKGHSLCSKSLMNVPEQRPTRLLALAVKGEEATISLIFSRD